MNYILTFKFKEDKLPILIIEISNKGKFYKIIKNEDKLLFEIFLEIWNKKYQIRLIDNKIFKNKKKIDITNYKLNNKNNIINIKNFIKTQKEIGIIEWQLKKIN